jgi:hypothetical protein
VKRTIKLRGSSLRRSFATISPSFTDRLKPPSTAEHSRFARISSILLFIVFYFDSFNFSALAMLFASLSFSRAHASVCDFSSFFCAAEDMVALTCCVLM